MTAESSPAPGVRCTFVALRGVDILFRRTVDLVDVPRVGERVHVWFDASSNIRGTVRDVRWTIPRDAQPSAYLQVELSPADRQRFARRTPLPAERTDAP